MLRFAVLIALAFAAQAGRERRRTMRWSKLLLKGGLALILFGLLVCAGGVRNSINGTITEAAQAEFINVGGHAALVGTMAVLVGAILRAWGK